MYRNINYVDFIIIANIEKLNQIDNNTIKGNRKKKHCDTAFSSQYHPVNLAQDKMTESYIKSMMKCLKNG